MNDLLLSIISYLIAPVLTALIGWSVGRRKSQADATKSEIENVEAALAIYRGIINDLQDKIKQMEKRIAELQARVDHFENQ